MFPNPAATAVLTAREHASRWFVRAVTQWVRGDSEAAKSLANASFWARCLDVSGAEMGIKEPGVRELEARANAAEADRDREVAQSKAWWVLHRRYEWALGELAEHHAKKAKTTKEMRAK